MSKELSTIDVVAMIEAMNMDKEKEKIRLKMQLFRNYAKFSEEAHSQYNVLLDNLKAIRKSIEEKRAQNKGKKSKSDIATKTIGSDIATKTIGDALEEIVDFIFKESFFYRVYTNKRTATNEIDQFVVLTNEGIQTLDDLKISKKVLINEDRCFLCECKNYADTVGATWVGKFNTLLDVSGNCKVGLIFSYDGLTGKETNWCDAHGLTKVIYRLSDEDNKRFILDINIRDLERLQDRDYTIFDLIKDKKDALIANVNSQRLYDEVHEGISEVEEIYKEIAN